MIGASMTRSFRPFMSMACAQHGVVPDRARTVRQPQHDQLDAGLLLNPVPDRLADRAARDLHHMRRIAKQERQIEQLCRRVEGTKVGVGHTAEFEIAAMIASRFSFIPPSWPLPTQLMSISPSVR